MSLHLPQYPEYKDSGVEWLGQIPKHWVMHRIDRLFTLRNEPPHEEDGRVTGYLDGRVTLRSNVASQKIKGVVKEAGWQRIHRGDFAISGMNAHLGGMGVSDSGGKCSPIYLVLNPHDTTNAHYIARVVRYIAHIGNLKTLVNTIRYNSADFKREDLKQLRVFCPPNEEQATIVRFLDTLDRRVNRLLRIKRRLIVLLNEQKQAIIHRAVTKGLNPEVPMKPSGIDWLGEIPTHWVTTRVGKHIELMTGFPFKSEEFSPNEADIRLLRGINIAPGAVRWNSVVYWASDDAPKYSAFQLRVDDIVIGMDRPIIGSGIRVAVIGEKDLPCLLLQRVARIRPAASISEKFLTLLFSGKSFAEYLAPIFTGVSVPHISPEQIRSYSVALPSLNEQREIVDWLQVNLTRIDNTIIQAKNEIELIREYRTRLIADVVTGKLDVRDAILPDAFPHSEESAENLLDEAGELDEMDADASEDDVLTDDAGEIL